MASRLKWIHFGRVVFYPASLLVHLLRPACNTSVTLQGLVSCHGRAEYFSLRFRHVCCSLTRAPTLASFLDRDSGCGS